MGKLHTLRRAIERNPERFIRWGKATGAYRDRGGEWHPTRWYSPSYMDFVQHVLEDIGALEPA